MLPVLLYWIFQWNGTDRLCDGAGNRCRLPGENSGFLVYEQADSCIAVSHRAWNSVFHRAADTAMLWMYGSCKKEEAAGTEDKVITRQRSFMQNKFGILVFM